ncbi:hypothetical protein FAGKG844_70025 [Frankia sp. AgKG'84/4]
MNSPSTFAVRPSEPPRSCRHAHPKAHDGQPRDPEGTPLALDPATTWSKRPDLGGPKVRSPAYGKRDCYFQWQTPNRRATPRTVTTTAMCLHRPPALPAAKPPSR